MAGESGAFPVTRPEILRMTKQTVFGEKALETNGGQEAEEETKKRIRDPFHLVQWLHFLVKLHCFISSLSG